MSQRIRYRKLADNMLQSVQVFQHETNGAQYKVLVNSTEHQWSVVDAATEIVAASGHNIKSNKLQLEVRNALSTLGVLLETEKRAPRTKKQSVSNA